jgi:thioesterase domain-containing protein
MPNVNALGYRSLARHLDRNQRVFGLQAQFPEDLEGEHSHAAVTSIATDYLEALRAVQPTGPYRLIGLCRGAHIAYEMACRLSREGHEIQLLGIIDTWVMENTYNNFWYFKYQANRMISRTVRGLTKQLGPLNKKARASITKTSDQRCGSDSLENTERKQKPFQTYFPGRNFIQTSFDGRIAVFRTHRQPHNRIRDSQLGWGKLAKGGVDLHFIGGSHDTVLKEPYVQDLAAALKNYLQGQVE